MTLTEKAAYLKGLSDGLKLDERDDTTKLLKAVVDTIDEIALTLSDLDDAYEELAEYTELIDEDLDELEAEIYGGDFDFSDCSVTCPACNEEIFLTDEDFEEDSIECPFCGEEIDLDIDECDCNCEDECTAECTCGCQD